MRSIKLVKNLSKTCIKTYAGWPRLGAPDCKSVDVAKYIGSHDRYTTSFYRVVLTKFVYFRYSGTDEDPEFDAEFEADFEKFLAMQ